MADRFYVNSSLSPGQLTLDGDEAHHLAVVCRLRPGQVVTLFNGDGNEYPARIDEVHKREVALTIESCDRVNRELPYPLHVAVPLPKGDRAQMLVEKLTELGVSVLTPLQTERSVVHPRETKLEKLHRYVIEASKQCGRNVLMTIQPLTPFAFLPIGERRGVSPPVLQSTGELTLRRSPEPLSPFIVNSEIRLIAHPDGTALRDLPSPSGPMMIAIGPEGGFTDAEVESARNAGWRTVSLGARILRVETAAIALAAWVAFHCPSGAQPLQ